MTPRPTPGAGLWARAAHTAGAGVVGAIAAVGVSAVTARGLGATTRGVYVAATTLVTVNAALAALSLGQVVIHRAAGRPADEWAPGTLSTVAALLVATTLASWAVAALVYVASDGRALQHVPARELAIAFVALPALMAIETGRYALTALGRLTDANLAVGAGALVGLALVAFAVVPMGAGLTGALVATAAGSVAGAALLGWRLRAHLRPRHASLPRARSLLRDSLRLHVNAVGSLLIAYASVLVANHFVQPADTAYLHLAMQIFSFGLLVSAAMAAVTYELVAMHGADAAWPSQRALLVRALGLSAVGVIVGYALAPLAVRLVGGREFAPAVPLLRLLLPGLLGATLSNVMASQWIGRGLFVQASALTLATGVLTVGCTVVLVPRLGIAGACVGTLVAYGLSLAVNGAFALRIDRRLRAPRTSA